MAADADGQRNPHLSHNTHFTEICADCFTNRLSMHRSKSKLQSLAESVKVVACTWVFLSCSISACLSLAGIIFLHSTAFIHFTCFSLLHFLSKLFSDSTYMARLKILICSAGCAVLTLAYWLARSGHQIVVCERSVSLRAAGAQIDLRARKIEVVEGMELIDITCSKRVEEEGIPFVDSQGNIKAIMGQ